VHGVCLSVSLSVCLLDRFTLRKNYWTDLRENFIKDVSVDKKGLIKFWKSSASGSGSRNFLKDSSTLRDRAFFHRTRHISGKPIGFSWSGSEWKFLPCALDKKVLLNFKIICIWSSDSGYGLRIRSRFALAKVYTLRMLVSCFIIKSFHILAACRPTSIVWWRLYLVNTKCALKRNAVNARLK